MKCGFPVSLRKFYNSLETNQGTKGFMTRSWRLGSNSTRPNWVHNTHFQDSSGTNDTNHFPVWRPSAGPHAGRSSTWCFLEAATRGVGQVSCRRFIFLRHVLNCQTRNDGLSYDLMRDVEGMMTIRNPQEIRSESSDYGIRVRCPRHRREPPPESLQRTKNATFRNTKCRDGRFKV